MKGPFNISSLSERYSDLMELGPVLLQIPIQIGTNLHLQRATEAAVVYLLVFQVKVDWMRGWQHSDLLQTPRCRKETWRYFVK